MDLTIMTGRANRRLAEVVALDLGIEPGRCIVEDFPDGEIRVEVSGPLQGHDVYIIQPTGPPVSTHLMELLLISDACRRSGAARLTAVIPYLGYARQDRRVRGTEPIGARLIADMLCTRLDGLITLDLHKPTIEGFFTIPIEHLSAIPLLAQETSKSTYGPRVLVAPDLGAVKLAQRYAEYLDLPVAYVQKVRLSGKEVSVRRVVGEVKCMAPILIDDMISTGGTMISSIEALLERGAESRITVVASHGLFVGDAGQRLSELPIDRVIVTDSLMRSDEHLLPIQLVSINGLIADTIRRLHSYYQ